METFAGNRYIYSYDETRKVAKRKLPHFIFEYIDGAAGCEFGEQRNRNWIRQIELKPKALIMFEPFYEHHDMQSLHGLLCRKYIELNDYTMNFQNILNKLKNDLKLKIKITKNVFGTNPFLPLSIIEIVPYV